MHKKLLFCLLTFCSLSGEAVTTKTVFAKYPNNYFIETGSQWGDGIQMALDAGFKNVYSIELAPFFHEYCQRRFEKNTNVALLLGNSTTVLSQILLLIHEPVTFWLDGHYSWGNTARGDTNSPILAELEAIKNHPVKTHTILIDDVRQFGTIEFDFIELDMIIKKIMEINPAYQITFEDGYVANDVLVAQIQ